MQRLIRIATLLMCCLLVTVPAFAHGNIYLTGHDLDFHCAFSEGPPNPCNAFKIAVLFAVAGAPDKTKPVLFLDQGSAQLDGGSLLEKAATNAGLAAAGITWQVIDPTGNTFNGVIETSPPLPLTTDNYSAIVFASDFSCGGGSPGADCDNDANGEAAINNRSGDIALSSRAVAG